MAKNALLPIGEVKLVETKGSKDCLDGTRIKAVIDGDNPRNIASIPSPKKNNAKPMIRFILHQKRHISLLIYVLLCYPCLYSFFQIFF